MDLNFPNYKTKKIPEEENSPFQVDCIDGFSMLLNKNKFIDKKIINSDDLIIVVVQSFSYTLFYFM